MIGRVGMSCMYFYSEIGILIHAVAYWSEKRKEKKRKKEPQT